jgi:spermidine/putrescine transport system permease protein
MVELVLRNGQLTSIGRQRRRGLALVGGAAAVLLLFLVLPAMMVCALAFMQRGDYGEVVPAFTGANFVRLLGFGVLEWSSDYLWILWRSLWVAAVATTISLTLAYPMAFFIAARPPRWRAALLACIAIPFCTNLVVRTYGWMLVLSSHLPPAELAQAVGLIDEGRALYPTPFAVHLGMASSLLPFAILPLYTNVERLDRGLIDAARDLYGNRWAVFRHAILPQTIPGLAVATILTFIPAVGMFLVSDLLGGAKYMLLGNLMQQQFGASRDWPFGAAIGCVVIVMTLIALAVVALFQRKDPTRAAI